MDLCALARDLADDVEPMATGRWAIFGHSMGAWLAFELLRELRRRGATPPALLIASASRAPHLAPQSQVHGAKSDEGAAGETLLHPLADDQLIAAVSERFGGMPPEVLDNPDLVRVLLPPLRADVTMVETYRFTAEAPLDVEIFAMGGTDDRAVSPSALAGWRHHTNRRFSSRLLPGGHFFPFAPPGGSSEQGGVSREGSRSPGPPPPALRVILAKLAEIAPFSLG